MTDSITQSLSERLSFPSGTQVHVSVDKSRLDFSMGDHSKPSLMSERPRAKTEYAVKHKREMTPRRSKTPHSLRAATPIG